jgi:3-phenylpropionate/trans-cinnamate dioxygenase ferredoxin reductase subunit
LKRVVIVGAGHAGGSAAAYLRQYGFQGKVTLIGAEPMVPYQRPPLSKAYLKGETDRETLKLKPDSFYAGQNIEFITRTVRRIDELDYDFLILATGSRPRRLAIPGADLPKAHMLRDVADADRLRAALRPGARLVIIGGGYIGLEVAASARALGAEVMILERESRLLARVASPRLSSFFQDYHRAKGVEIRTSVELPAIDFPGSVVLIGIGAQPNDELARQAGLKCENGVVVDQSARTSDPNIFAIGDVACRPYDGRMVRIESVANALQQARQAASAIAGRPPPPSEVPWFWSDQYDLKLQIAGLPFDADRLELRGSPETAKFAVFHLKGERLLAVEAVNSPAEFMAGKRRIQEQA